MGNKLSCCWCPNTRPKRCQPTTSAEPDYESEVYEVVAGNTVADEPSPAAVEPAQLNSSAGDCTHVQQHIPDPQMPEEQEQTKSKHEWPTPFIPKYEYSSCSTLYVGDSTITKPNLDIIIECVALGIEHLIKHRHGNRTLDIFEEGLHPLTKGKTPQECGENEPDLESISRFVSAIFAATQLRPGCGLITLTYLERLLSCADIDICPTNWKRVVLGAFLESSIWDTPAQWKVDDCEILKDITREDMIDIEWQFRKLLQFNIEISRTVFTKYYFDFYTWAYDDDNLVLTFHPLSKERAQKLEAIGGLCDNDDYIELCTSAIRRSVSGVETPKPKFPQAMFPTTELQKALPAHGFLD